MAHEKNAHAVLAFELGEQRHDLLLDCDVEGADGLIAHEEFRPENHRASNTDALALAAAEFVRVAIHEIGGDTYPDEHFCDSASTLLGAEFGTVDTQRLLHDLANGHARVKAGQWVLEHNLQLTTQ
ncbi:MAG TPA: hypothetical protein VGC34_10045, partial [Steroidobacteraceae bacterium]